MKKQVITFMLIVLVVVPVYSQKWVWLYPYPTPDYIRDFSFVNSTTGFLITANRELWKTVDNGVTWNATVFEEDLKSIFFLNETYGWIMCLKTSDYSTSPYILRTVDNGNTWSSHALSGSRYDYDDSHALFFLSDRIGWVACEGGKIKKTTDGGQTWIDKSIGNSSYNLFYIHFIDQNNGVVIGRSSYDFCFARTSDGGNQWEKKISGLSNSLYGAAFMSPDRYYVAGSNGIILRTTNYGRMWSFPSETGFADLQGLAFTSQLNGWAVGENGTLLKTSDGGDSWQELILGIASDYNKISFLNITTGWILGNQNSSNTLSQQVMLSTQDGGQNWNNHFRSFEDNLTFNDADFTSRTSGWIISNNSIYSTSDNGRT